MHIYVYNQYIQFSVSIRNRMCTQHTHTHTHTSERLRQSPQTFLWFACHVAYEEHAEVLSLIIHMLMLWNTLQRFSVWSFICRCCETHCRGLQSDHTYADVLKNTAEVFSLIIYMQMLWNTLQRSSVWSYICWCCETHCRGLQSDHSYADVVKHTAEVFSLIIHMQML